MPYRTPSFLLAAAVCMLGSSVIAQSSVPKEEVTFISDARQLPDREYQTELRHRNAWSHFKAQHPRWSVEFNEASAMPRRAFGDPITVAGSDLQAKALAFLATELEAFDLPLSELTTGTIAPTSKLTYVHFAQAHQGLSVLGAKGMVKFDAQGRVIGFSTDLYNASNVDLQPTVGEGAAMSAAQGGLSTVLSSEYVGLRLLPVPSGRSVDMRLVHEVLVKTRAEGIPGNYRSLVDAHTGKLWYRSNQVLNCDHGDAADAGADLQMVATAYPGSPLQAPITRNLPNMDVTIGGTLFHTDADGFIASGVPGPVSTQYQLRGRFANVNTNGITPVFSGTLSEGANTVPFAASANVRECSAYIYANEIHAHVNTVLPDFTGMDFSIPLNIDLTTGNCNANYDGSALNFYSESNNCRSSATINDVVYHEYGHGINDKFYTSMTSNFSNGAMNEAYADMWAMTLTNNPVLGLGFNLDDPESFIRRYDIDPKAYPVDITNEVHSDGEIIAGAWWDTYRLLGFDYDLWMELWVAAYPGLQAATFNGNEGPAFRDVLLDVLQADDDDGDITNGTIHGDAIVEAFAIHGITIISDAELLHDDLRSAPADETISITADILITFPSTDYLAEAALYYKVNNATVWNPVPMTTTDGTSYSADIPAQPAGTLVAYYMGLTDIFGQTSSVTPIGADRVDPGLPYYMLVSYELEAKEDADFRSELGAWVEGQPTDNAVTGQWEFGPPLGSFSDVNDPSTVCQTGTQHTEGGELCWFTGNATSISAGIGDNDVDDGSTTLLGPNIDLTDYTDPAISYWRWYTNNPPSGANPNADWWQVYASSNNGSSWVPVEDTKSGERNWRRKVFRVQDVLGDVSSIRLKFIASDSIRPGTNQDGGSLIEGALDDIELWDVVAPNSIEELANASIASIWPIPANGTINVSVRNVRSSGVRLEVLDMTGRSVLQPAPLTVGADLQRLDVGGLAEGQYILRLRWAEGSTDRRFSIVR